MERWTWRLRCGSAAIPRTLRPWGTLNILIHRGNGDGTFQPPLRFDKPALHPARALHRDRRTSTETANPISRSSTAWTSRSLQTPRRDDREARKVDRTPGSVASAQSDHPVWQWRGCEGEPILLEPGGSEEHFVTGGNRSSEPPSTLTVAMVWLGKPAGPKLIVPVPSGLSV